MSKPTKQKSEPKQEPVKAETQRLLYFYREDGAFAFAEVELPVEVIKAHGKFISKTNPDILAIMLSQLTRKVQDIFDL